MSRRRPWAPVAAVVTAAALAVGPLSAGAETAIDPGAETADDVDQAPADDEPELVILQMRDDPVARYTGGVSGYAATASEPDERLDSDSTAATRYESYLLDRQEGALAEVGLGEGDIVDQFTTAFNGVVVEATPAQVRELALRGAVVASWENEVLYPQTISTPDELGLTGSDGVWQERFGGSDDAGEGVVVGVVDTGIVPENPSFAALPGRSAPEGWRGTCETAPGPAGFACNSKVIGARSYGEQYGNLIDGDVPNPRDVNGHGSHTAGTAAGNADVPMAVDGVERGVGSGIAPAAQIAVYKVGWGSEGAGTAAGLVAAIEDATADGVDVLNLSMGSGITASFSAHGLALLGAAEAGVFVSASAGNAGMLGAGTVENAYPWVTTVGATTPARPRTKTVSFGGRTLEGTGSNEGVTGPLRLSAQAIIPDLENAGPDYCSPGMLIEELVRGQVMACETGGNPFAVSEYLAELGAAGVIFYPATEGPVQPAPPIGYPAIPAISLDGPQGRQVRSFGVGNMGAEVTISPPSPTVPVSPQLAPFSSLGPSTLNGGNLIKPDVVAPGVDIVAAYARGAEDYVGISGTSMAAPHVAGLGALLRSANPDWSPSRIRSALMTTAQNTDTDGGPIQRLGVDQTSDGVGAGAVRPPAAFAPGLAYETSGEDWAEYVCVVNPVAGADCPEVPGRISDLNEPGISVSAVPFETVVTRTVTDVSGEGGTWTAELEHDPALEITVEPSTLTVEPGGTADFEVTIRTVSERITGPPLRGSLTWVDGDNRVRSPIVVDRVSLSTPPLAAGSGTTGSVTFPVAIGVDAQREDLGFWVRPTHLTPIRPRVAVEGVAEYDFRQGGPDYVQFETRAEDYPPGTDVDLTLFSTQGAIGLTPVAQSIGPGADERLVVPGLRSGAYLLGIATDTVPIGMDRPFHEVILTAPLLSSDEPAPPQNGEVPLTVDPEEFTAQTGDVVDVTASWEGLEPDQQYYGLVAPTPVFRVENQHTVVTVDTTTDWSAQAERWTGRDRYETAALVSERFPDRVDTVYLAAGDGYADALASGPAAARGLVPGLRQDGYSAPLLLVKPDGIPEDTRDALERLRPRRVVVLGGTTRIGAGVFEQVEDMVGDGRVQRVEGRDRYGTAAALAGAFDQDRGTVYVARGDAGGLADALGAGALAGAEGSPVLLVQEDRIPGATADALTALNPDDIVVVGGSESISEDVEGALADWGRVSRLYGDDRYDTSAVLSAQFEGRPDRAFVARGDEFVDALAISSLAGGQKQPVLLTQPQNLPRPIPPAIAALEPGVVTVVGGPTAVSDTVLELLGDPSTYLPQD